MAVKKGIHRYFIFGKGGGAALTIAQEEFINVIRKKKREEKAVNITITHPDVASEWNYEANLPVTPKMITYGVNEHFSWICKRCSYTWNAAPSDRCRRVSPTGCPACAGKVVTSGKNDIASQRPDVARDWDYNKNAPLTPSEVATHSNIRYGWICSKCGHAWVATPSDRCRNSNPKGCPACAGKVVIPGKNDIASQYPNVAKEWDYNKNFPLIPAEVAGHSHKNYGWICGKCGHAWDAKPSNRCRNTNPTGCPACAGKVVIPGENDIASQHPDVAKEWDYVKNYPLTPAEVTRRSLKDYGWICSKCGHAWDAKPSNRCRSTNPTGCPACAGKIVVPGKNDIASQYPDIAKEWDYSKNYPIIPSEVAKSSNINYGWICSKCGHTWDARPSRRCNCTNPSGCPACAGKAVIPGKNDLASQYPDVAKEWDYNKNYPIIPSNVAQFTPKRYWWHCACGNSWRDSVSNRTLGLHKCAVCTGHKRAT